MTLGPTARLLLLASAALVGCAPAPAGGARTRDHRDHVGMWVGKWDGIWCVQFTVTENADSSDYSVLYEHEERPGQPLERAQLVGRLTGGVLSVGSLIDITFEDRDHAVAYGRFPTPRTARLVRQSALGCVQKPVVASRGSGG